MKNTIYIILLFIITTLGCQKDQDTTESTAINNQGGPCIIYYKDFIPDFLTVMPNNNSITAFIDVDGDSINDARIFLWSGYQHFGPTVIDNYQITITGIDSVQFANLPTPLDTSKYIGMNTIVKPSYPIEYVAYMVNHIPFSQKDYLGFRKYKNGNYYFGWIHLQVLNKTELILDDLAMNTCANDSIKIGHH